MQNLSNKNLRICVVGAGDMGLRHIKGWQQVNNVEVVAIVDDVPERLQAAGREFKVADLFADYQTAISETKPNVVSVCIPTAFHAPISLYAMEHGAHVLCEKPIALTLADADAMIETAQRKGVLLAVGFMLRYSQAVQKLKQQWIDSNTIGRPIMVVSENFMEVRPKILMHDRNINGGPLVDYWCHHFDLWSYLFDSKPVSISGYGTIFARDKAEVAHLKELAIDTAGVALKFQSSDIGQLATSWGLPRALAGQAISNDKFIGPNGLIIGDVRRHLTLLRADGTSEEIYNTGRDWWHDEIAEFAHIIRSGGTPLVTGQQGREALQVSLAAIEAIESGQTVTLS